MIDFIMCYYSADIEAECQDDFMKIRIGFNGSFTGLLYSAGMEFCALFHARTFLFTCL